MAEQRISTSKVAGTWAWFFQRLSAVLLVVLLGLHIYVDHFVDMGEPLTVAGIHTRVKQLLYIVVDYSLLGMVLFHGLNGTRTVLFDFDMFIKRKKLVDVGLWVLGVATMIWGIFVLFPFING
jgi:succinate dehydrogenase hydrophobic anchor subunit